METPEIENPFKEELPKQKTVSVLPILEVTTVGKMYLKETASWTTFFAVLNFIGAGFMTLAAFAFLMFTIGGNIMNFKQGEFVLGIVIFFVYLAVAGMIVAFGIYLLRFAQKISDANMFNNSSDLEEALSKMRSYWKMKAIITISLIAVYLLFIPIAAVIGVFSNIL